jgi:hypothetical protein
MPVVVPGVKMWSRQSSEATQKADFKGFDIAFTEVYQIQTTPDATEIEVYVDGGLPGAGETFPGFPFAYAQKAQLQRISPIYWLATVNYVGEIGGVSKDSSGENAPVSPLAVPPQFTWDDVESEQEIDEDFDGNPIVTTAGERVRGRKALFADQLLTVTRNFLTFSPYLQAVYRRSVNSDVFQGWPPGTCKLMKLSASNVYDPVIGYFKVTGVFQFRYPYNTTPEKAWYDRWPNMGLYQIDSGGKRVPCVDDNRNPLSTPQYLDAAGRQTTADNVIWNETKLYGSLPYNALGFFF